MKRQKGSDVLDEYELEFSLAVVGDSFLRIRLSYGEKECGQEECEVPSIEEELEQMPVRRLVDPNRPR